MTMERDSHPALAVMNMAAISRRSTRLETSQTNKEVTNSRKMLVKIGRLYHGSMIANLWQ
jgi:hypothetical protein